MSVLADVGVSLLTTLSAITVAILVMLKTDFLSKYLQKKGENLATKEDIEDITDKIERTKVVYTKDMAELNARLDSAKFRLNLAYQKEFEVLQEAWQILTELVESQASVLRSINLQQRDAEKSDCLKHFFDTSNKAYKYITTWRPFYDKDVSEKLLALATLCQQATMVMTVYSPYKTENNYNQDYWNEVKEYAIKVNQAIDASCEAIRNRVTP